MTTLPRRRPARLAALLAPLLLGLSGCGGGYYYTYSAAELKPYYTETPAATLPVQSSSPLGEGYTFSGTVKDWKQPKVTDLYYQALSYNRPTRRDGQLSPQGVISFTTPLLDLAEPPGTLRQTMGLEGEYCPFDTLKLSQESQVRAISFPNFTYWYEDVQPSIGQTLRPQTSPPPSPFGLISLADPYRDVRLIWTPEPFTAQGEVRCLSGGEQRSGGFNPPSNPSRGQVNILINMKLERGWNAVQLKQTELGLSTRGVYQAQSVLSAFPADELTKWKFR
jgi:hypothetical protein